MCKYANSTIVGHRIVVKGYKYGFSYAYLRFLHVYILLWHMLNAVNKVNTFIYISEHKFPLKIFILRFELRNMQQAIALYGFRRSVVT